MNENFSEATKTAGLSDAQIDKLVALQEAGRKIDFVYYYADDGRDPRRAAAQFDEFYGQLKAFSEEGSVAQKFAAALWDHLAPRFVGWRPEFIEGVEARELGGVLTRLDQDIDAKLGRAFPPELRVASQEVRTRFDDLLFAYEAGAWRDTRTPGEVRDALIFVAGLDEKIRNMLYGNARSIDLRSTIEDYHPWRVAGGGHQSDASFEVRAYQAQLASVADILDRLRTAGIEVHSGLTFNSRLERQQAFSEGLANDRVCARHGRSFEREQTVAASRPAADEAQYWLGVAQAASANAGMGRSESLVQSTRRGRSL
jgi:hypothetical protein